MRDIRGYEVPEVETTSNRSKLLGAAVVALGIGALGVYAFASGGSPTQNPQQLASNQIRTTPEGAQQMPPPVTPTPLDQKPVGTPSKLQAGASPLAQPSALEGTPLDPKPAKVKPKPADDNSQQAVAKHMVKSKAATREMTPPENAQPAQPIQPAAVPEQPAPQETPAPTDSTVPPQGQ